MIWGLAMREAASSPGEVEFALRIFWKRIHVFMQADKVHSGNALHHDRVLCARVEEVRNAVSGPERTGFKLFRLDAYNPTPVNHEFR